MDSLISLQTFRIVLSLKLILVYFLKRFSFKNKAETTKIL